MTKKNLLTLFVALTLNLVNLGLFAQIKPVENADYRLAERFSPTKISKMVFSTSVNPKWLKTGDQFWYSDTTSQGVSFYLVDMDKRTKTFLFDNHKMASMLTKITKDPYDWQHLPVIKPKFKKNDTVFQFDVTSSQYEEKKKDSATTKSGTKKDSTVVGKDSLQAKKGSKTLSEKDKEKDKVKKKIFHLEYNLKTGELYEIKDWKEEKDNPDWANISPNGEYIFFSRDYNLWWMDKDNYQKARKDEKDSTVVEHQFTTDGVKDYAFGGGYQATVNDDEKKIKEEKKKRKGAQISWSRDSKKFAMIRTDERKVKDLWVVNVLKEPRPELQTYKYQMPGEKNSPQDELWVFDLSAKKGKKLAVDQFKDQNISIHRANLTNKERLEDYVPTMWLSETSDKLFITRKSRDLYRIDICSVNTETGETKVLIEERMNTYIETKRLNILNNGKELIHWSERDGWAHYYLYDENGTLKNQITSGPWHCGEIVKVDEKNRVLYFVANGRESNENPYYEHLYRVNLDGTGLQLLNPGNYTNNMDMSDSYRYFVNTYSRVNSVPKSEIRDNTGKPVMDLATADLKNLFAAGYKFPEPFIVKAADGITDIYGVMYKPFNFDSTKVYPLIEYVYPGPQTEAVNAAFSSRMDRTDRVAQLGFIVITLGNRGGNPNRSKWYHNYGYGDLRDYGLADKKYVAEQLADKYKFIDITKVGITGHSGGGFMSTAALCQYPDFYKVAVSSSGNHENNIYNRWWSETHQGVQEKLSDDGETQFLYDIEKNTQLAKNLKGKLLLITGDIDDNVHSGNTLRMANALIRANKRFDIFIMPGQRHAYGDFTEYTFWLKADYFCKHLIGDYSISTDIFEMNRETKMTPGKRAKIEKERNIKTNYMETINIAILGCGTVGGGVVQIVSEMENELGIRANKKIVLKKIVELDPIKASERFSIPMDLFCGSGKELTLAEASQYIDQIIASDDIDLVVETIGGKSDFVHNLCIRILNSGKHLVTANKSLLAERGKDIFEAAEKKNVKIGFEAAVCGSIPIIKTIKESFTGDKVLSISGIMNGTSNYILTQMQSEKLEFDNALQLAQENGYAEADPTLDINGGDAGHKLILLIKLAYGIDVSKEELPVIGIENISKEDIDFADEIDARIKLICYAKQVNGDIYATVRPMLVKSSNFLSEVSGTTNAVRLNNKYSGIQILIGKGAGSTETAMSIVSDIVFIARYGEKIQNLSAKQKLKFAVADQFIFPYLITFHTGNVPGTTGFIATAIGKQEINIETVSHNRHTGERAIFSVATMPCTLGQITKAIEDIKKEKPDMLMSEPKIMPILY